jgi:hypothetical protein
MPAEGIRELGADQTLLVPEIEAPLTLDDPRLSGRQERMSDYCYDEFGAADQKSTPHN